MKLSIKMYKNKSALNANRDVQLSKLLSYILRHGANKYNINLKSNGYIEIQTLLNLDQFRKSNFTLCDIQRVVSNNDKNRFNIITNENGNLEIKANQGHSLPVKSLELEEISDSSEIPIVVHGTYYKFLKSIISTGLQTMNRNHIHFACTDDVNLLYNDKTVLSGFRRNCEILIYINTESALNTGIKFFKSENGVILSSGILGQGIPSKYFLKIIDRKTGSDLTESMYNVYIFYLYFLTGKLIPFDGENKK